MIRRAVVVAGRVQGVGYRQTCARVAGRLGVTGAVRNLDDGRVEVVAGGRAEAVAQLIDWCRRGPAGSRVDEVTVTEVSVTDRSLADEEFRVVG